ncbi:DAK2 domain-containing protein [Georgenia wangjunii]|uniref:DAK2 domain-containing protein n=1 Tax=Georgenia wangjunii TaxID=3117730 RepID=UPI002F26193A
MNEAFEVLDAAALRGWSEHGLRSLLAVRGRIDALNVFPVPDSDTGTNLVRTLAGALCHASRLPAHADPAELTAAAARGALYSARGNSGIILSQAIRGFASAVAAGGDLDGAGLADALAAVAAGARAAVATPVEGTILTAADEAAAAARDAPAGASLLVVAEAAARAAQEALGRTPSQLAALRGPGVVDSGAAGFTILLATLAAVLAGKNLSPRARADRARRSLDRARDAAAAVAAASAGGSGDAGPVPAHGFHPDDHDHGAGEFEVMYVLRASEPDADALRERLGAVGHSVAVVGGPDGAAGGLWHVHVHADVPLETLARIGTMEQVCVRSLRESARGDVGVVACTRAPGLAAPLARAGATVALHPDAAGIARAAADTGAHEVLVLPCDDDSARVADDVCPGPGRAAGSAARQPWRVVGTRTELAVLAVASEWVAGQGAAAQAERAERLAGRARTTALDLPTSDVTHAGGATATATAASDAEASAVAAAVGALLRGEDEVVTVVLGARVLAEPARRDAVVAAVEAAVREAAPDAEVLVLDGSQERPDLLVGAE